MKRHITEYSINKLPRAAALIVMAAASAGAQKAPAIRQIGRLERATTDSLASATTALRMPDGRVLVNDLVGRRLLLLDSTLAHAAVVADTTATTANAYGSGAGTLISYRGDSALFIAPSSLSMLVIGPSGTIAHVMAVPRPDDAQALAPVFGIPGVDARGRLVYFMGALPGIMMLGLNEPIPNVPRLRAAIAAGRRTDSGAVVGVSLATRTVDTIAAIAIPKSRREMKTDAQGLLQAIETTPDPLPLVDAWSVLLDGAIAIARARDYHIDWLGADGRWTSTPKVPFDWEKVSDERKQTLIDSTVKVWQDQYDRVKASRRPGGAASTGGRGGSTGGRGGGGAGAGGPVVEMAPNIAVRASLNELPDYMPPFAHSAIPAMRSDADGNLWIRTSAKVNGQPVYDIVNRRGELVDRVQLPAFRTIAGFGPGVVYMAVKDSSGVVRLERARIK